MNGGVNVNLLRLNKKQSIFVVSFILVVVPILGFITTLYTNSTLFIPINAIVIAFLGSTLAKKLIK